jgi:hypothetical protein
MEILEAFDLTGSFRAAGELSGCSHHIVAGHVAAREAGGGSDPLAVRLQLIDEFLPKLEEWMEHSRGKIARALEGPLRSDARPLPTGWHAIRRTVSTR